MIPVLSTHWWSQRDAIAHIGGELRVDERSATTFLMHAMQEGELLVYSGRRKLFEHQPELIVALEPHLDSVLIRDGLGLFGQFAEHPHPAGTSRILDIRLLQGEVREKIAGLDRELSLASTTQANECFEWLKKELVKRSPETHSKTRFAKEAKDQFSMSGRAFERVWAEAIKSTGRADFKKPGRKKTSKPADSLA